MDWGDGTVEAVPLEVRAFNPPGAPGRTIGVVNAAHRYASSGNYTVLLTVTDNAGDTGFDTSIFTVNAVVDQAAPAGTLVYPLANSIVQTDSGYVDIHWVDFGDGRVGCDHF